MRFCIDIDDTILFSDIDEKGEYHLKNYDRLIVEKINQLYDSGHTIILWTGRHWNHLHITIEQLNGAGIKYHSLLLSKPVADFYIDDKAIKPFDFKRMEII